MDTLAKKELITIKEAAHLLDVSERTVRRALKEGRLPGRRVGRVWRIPCKRLREQYFI